MEYKGFNISDIDTVLLYDILQELKEIKAALGKPEPVADNLKIGDSVSEEKPVKANVAANKKENKVCKHCGKSHDKPVDYAMCAKRKENKI